MKRAFSSLALFWVFVGCSLATQQEPRPEAHRKDSQPTKMTGPVDEGVSIRTTGTVLDEIVANKRTEVAALKQKVQEATALAENEAADEEEAKERSVLLRTAELWEMVKQGKSGQSAQNGTSSVEAPSRFERSLLDAAARVAPPSPEANGKPQFGCVGVIAEIKRASPSKGNMADIRDPVELAEKYCEGGAAAISILTDEKYFKGTPRDLRRVADAVGGRIPILRKDFIVDDIQVCEAKALGASAVLLIVATLGELTKEFLKTCSIVGIEALVEVHDEDELRIALESGARIVGVNSRNLKTFVTDLAVSERLGQSPEMKAATHVKVKVGESGVHKQEDAARLYKAGFNAVLVGEALVKSEDAVSTIRQFSSPPL